MIALIVIGLWIFYSLIQFGVLYHFEPPNDMGEFWFLVIMALFGPIATAFIIFFTFLDWLERPKYTKEKKEIQFKDRLLIRTLNGMFRPKKEKEVVKDV